LSGPQDQVPQAGDADARRRERILVYRLKVHEVLLAKVHTVRLVGPDFNVADFTQDLGRHAELSEQTRNSFH
jgi:hypothetical protein